jgi:4-hydroxy-3-polyprenylbenzoate decarboxylase
LAGIQRVQRFLDFAFGFARNDRKAKMKLVIAATGASGAIYLQRLLEQIDCKAHEVHLVMSAYAREVAKQELDDFKIPAEVLRHSESDMKVPFVSGSARFDAMVIVPCSMATLGRIASGCSDSVLLRSADVFLKERRKLILVPRETPWNLIHARNVVTLLEAGAIVLPAIPSFYSRPNSLNAVVDTVVWRILDQIELPHQGAYRWGEEKESAKTSRKKS